MKLPKEKIIIKSDLTVNEKEKENDGKIYKAVYENCARNFSNTTIVLGLAFFLFMVFVNKKPFSSAEYVFGCVVLSFAVGLCGGICTSLFADIMAKKKSYHDYESYKNIEETIKFIELVSRTDASNKLFVYKQNELAVTLLKDNGELEQKEFIIEKVLFKDTESIVLEFAQTNSFVLSYENCLIFPRQYFWQINNEK